MQSHDGREPGIDRVAADIDLLTHLLAIATGDPGARRLAETLVAELRTLPRVLAADMATLARLGVAPRAQETLATVRECLIRALERELANMDVISGREALLDYLHVRLAHERRERFRVLFLDGQNRLLADEEMGVGTVDQVSVHIREVIHRALNFGAVALILVHNHPSGSLEPRREDINFTRHLADAARILGMRIHDRILITEAGDASFRQLGHLI